MGIETGTSYPEQCIYLFVKEYFPDAINGAKINNQEADILIDSIKCIIEIDGLYWHKDKADMDYKKTVFFNQQGFFVIRVRDNGLPKLSSFDGQIINANLKFKAGGDNKDVRNLVSTVYKVLNYIASRTKNKVLSGKILNLNFIEKINEEKLPSILSPLYNEEVHPNILDYAGGQLWDYEKNNPLNPKNVSLENCPYMHINLICPEPNPILKRRTSSCLALHHWCQSFESVDQNDKYEVLMFNFKKEHCSLMHLCMHYCSIMDLLVNYMIENYIPVYPNIMSTPKLYLGLTRNIKKLVDAILSDNCTGIFLQSIRIYYQSHKKIPHGWAKTPNQKDKYKRFCEILSKPIEQDKVGDLFTKYDGIELPFQYYQKPRFSRHE